MAVTGSCAAFAPSFTTYCLFRFLTGMALSGISLNCMSLGEWWPHGPERRWPGSWLCQVLYKTTPLPQTRILFPSPKSLKGLDLPLPSGIHLLALPTLHLEATQSFRAPS